MAARIASKSRSKIATPDLSRSLQRGISVASRNWAHQASVRRPKQRWVACRPPHYSPVRSPVRRTALLLLGFPLHSSASASSTSAAAASASSTPPATATAASTFTAATEAPTSATTPTPIPSSASTATTSPPRHVALGVVVVARTLWASGVVEALTMRPAVPRPPRPGT
ncbi:unnamed protein product [Closterium sp. NIES-53]